MPRESLNYPIAQEEKYAFLPARNLLLLNLQEEPVRGYSSQAVPVADMHHDEVEVLQAHQALQWLMHTVDRQLKAAFVWCVSLPNFLRA